MQALPAQAHGRGTGNSAGNGAYASCASTPEEEAKAATREARELVTAMDPEETGYVGFSSFAAACLAGRAADETGSRIAFAWLDRRRKNVITPGDIEVFTGQVMMMDDDDAGVCAGRGRGRGMCSHLCIYLATVS